MLNIRPGELLEADVFDSEDGVEGVGPPEEDKDEFYPDGTQWESEEEEKVKNPRPAAAAAAITEKVTHDCCVPFLHLCTSTSSASSFNSFSSWSYSSSR